MDNNSKIIESLKLQEVKAMENSLTYLMMHKGFTRISPREQAKLLTQKVLSIRSDYSKIESMLSAHTLTK